MDCFSGHCPDKPGLAVAPSRYLQSFLLWASSWDRLKLQTQTTLGLTPHTYVTMLTANCRDNIHKGYEVW